MMFERAFPDLRSSLVLLRVGVAGLFLAHAVARIVLGTIPQFAGFMASKGFPWPEATVWAITLVELICGVLVLFGVRVRYSMLGLLAIAAGGIILIHAQLGWFVGEHGTGGSEYSVCLILGLLVVGAADRAGMYSRTATG